jgi:uncharacterized protein YggU (UPF0235/DUF167 family)
MKEREFNLHDGKSGSAITVRVVLGSSQNEISEVLGDGTIKIRLTTFESDENANRALIAFLSEVLQVKPAQIEIIGGIASNDKLVTILDIDKTVVQDRILNHKK